jgi:hypothetical protein
VRNLLEGDAAENVCSVACNACKRCVQDAAEGLIHMEHGLAVVDYDRIDLANPKAVERCPTGAIVWVEGNSSPPSASRPGAEWHEKPAKYPGIPRLATGATRWSTPRSWPVKRRARTPSPRRPRWARVGPGGGPGKRNVFGRRLLFFEPEGEHAAAAVTAGMSMTGTAGHELLERPGYRVHAREPVRRGGKRLPYVLNVAARAMTKHALNVHAGHDDYHAVDDTGFFQLFAKNVQEAADLTLIAHRIAELSLTPGVSAQDGFLTSHVIETCSCPSPSSFASTWATPRT